MRWDNLSLCDALRAGKLAVMPTDTIYGIVGSAFDEAAVNRIYQARQRAPAKPCIILIGDLAELEKFSIKLSKDEKNKFEKTIFQILKHEVKVNYRIEPKLLGGLRIHLGDWKIDGTLIYQLERLKRSLGGN